MDVVLYEHAHQLFRVCLSVRVQRFANSGNTCQIRKQALHAKTRILSCAHPLRNLLNNLKLYPSEIWPRSDWQLVTDVSQKHPASILRAAKGIKLFLTPLQIEAECFFETSGAIILNFLQQCLENSSFLEFYTVSFGKSSRRFDTHHALFFFLKDQAVPTKMVDFYFRIYYIREARISQPI